MRTGEDFEVDPRDERLLHWRFHFAEGEMWTFGSAFDARAVAVVRRARRVDAALALCTRRTREVLFRAYGARADGALAHLSPQRFAEAGVLVVQPLLCNLVELAPEAAQLHAKSGSGKPLRQWLERLSAKSGSGKGDAGAVRALLDAARRVLAAAGDEYSDARAGHSAEEWHADVRPAQERTGACWVDCPHESGACLGAQRSWTRARARRDVAQSEGRRAAAAVEAAETARQERAAIRAVVAFLRWGESGAKKRRAPRAA